MFPGEGSPLPLYFKKGVKNMAKKKINIKSVTADVPSGDVNITYKNVRIAGLSESTTAVLETEDTICEDDIEVEYTKPAGGVKYIAVTVDSSESIKTNNVYGGFFEIDNNAIIKSGINAAKAGYPEYAPRTETYAFGVVINAESDNLNVSVNGSSIPYNLGGYTAVINSETYPTEYNLVVTNKE